MARYFERYPQLRAMGLEERFRFHQEQAHKVWLEQQQKAYRLLGLPK